MEAKVLANLMAANDDFAGQIRSLLAQKNIPMFNLIGGPGCGKTTLLEQTISAVASDLRLAVIEGDIATPRDAERIAEAGAESIQINTQGSCHLDANLVLRALEELDLVQADLVVVENVGNLVCPAEFDIGEHAKVGMLSVTEGDDKVLKYPLLFREAKVVILNKVDLLPYVSFDRSRFYDDLKQLNGKAQIIEISATTGDGMETWFAWLANFASDSDPALHLEAQF
ncbi:MAG: hydrogenase nickel incorporation protein HypB [Candidatus Latescibacteria bacterium]|nr:hydrogenase nickel incorporation protein HypB [Candidatus Latescibacterota bacterium]